MERCPSLFALPTPDFTHEDATDGAQRGGCCAPTANAIEKGTISTQ